MTKINVKTNIQVTITIMAILATSLCVSRANGAIAQKHDNLNRNRYLLLDSRIIEDTENAVLTVGTIRKDKRNPLFVEDKPWEPRYDNVYANVIYDEQEKIYKCWYSPFIIDERTSETPQEKRNPESQNYMNARPNHREMGVCYAVSKDGIHWEKPELGLVEFNGNKKNNLLMRGYHFKGIFTGPHGAGVFKDLHESDLAKRYKMFFKGSKMSVAFSPDGLHWNLPIECPQIDAHGDTHNNAFWDPASGKYIGITRLKYGRPSIRQVAWTESPDFINWTKAKVVLEGVKPRLQTHDMVVFPIGGVYIGLLGMMDFPNAKSNFHTRQHVELAWSPDSKEWHRIQPGTPFIGHSPANAEVYGKMPYDWGTIFASAPIFRENEIQIYYGACDWYFFDWRIGYLALARLRPDGWAGYEQIAGNKPAFITTTTVVCTGNKLQLCADVRKKGFVKVTVLDKDNRRLAQSKSVKKTVTDAKVKWLDRFSFENLRGKDVRLKFELKNAKLYSFGFDLKSQAKIDLALSKSVVDRKEDVERIVVELIEQKKTREEARRKKERAEQIRDSLPPEERIPDYIAELRNVNPDVRSNASDQLAKIALRVKYIAALEPAVTPLVAALSDKDMDVRDESTEALGNIGSRIKDKALRKFVIDALVRMLSDEDAEVREESAESLGKIASRAEDKAALKPAIQPLVKALSDEDAGVREYAADALGNITSRVEDKAAQKPAIQPSIEVLSGGNDDLKRDRYLLLDSRIIDKTIGVKLTLGKVKKHPGNPLFGQDRPWEHHYDNFYGNIIYDEELKQFRLWYLNFIDGENSLLYAYSDNGLNWVKPNLGKVEYNGKTNNNIVMMGRHGVSVFKDLRETDPAKCFKLFAKHEAVGRWRDQHLEVAFSADGINWSDPIPQKQISATADTDNNAFWAPTLNKYVAMTRQWSRCPYNDQTQAPEDTSGETDPAIDNRKGYRQVARTESADFLNWTRAELVLEGLDTRYQTHCLPVFYYAGVYIGMPGIWDTLGERKVYSELAWSPDTVEWYRINPGTPLIPNSDVKGDYDYGMVWRCVSPLFLDSDEVWLYYGGFDMRHAGKGRKGYLCLATMKKDRWAGYEAGSYTGTVETTAVNCNGKALNICADVKDGGSIRVEVVGVDGLSLGDSIPVTADVTDGVVTWKAKDLSALIGKRIKIRFELKNATLYSFSFLP